MKHTLKITIPIVAIVLFLYGFAQYQVGELPTGYNELFAGSGECLLCHNDQVNGQGESVSIISDWRSTMMANAAKDPLWRAKVSHEVLVNPALQDVIENKCTSCHAPLGNFNAHHLGQEYYSIAEMEADSLALDGVQCTVCHQIKAESMGSFSGHLDIGDQKITWGPYETPFTQPMINNTGYTPAYGPQITDSRLCGNCHTLLTNSVDLNGQPTGNEFVEQAVYHEWVNSSFPGVGTSCQTCHVPRIDDPVKISTMPPWLEPRSPFGMHHFAGANVFILNILKDNAQELGVAATDVQMDSTIARATRMLQERSLSVILSEEARTDDTLFISLKMNNQVGHKFPSGYPSRRVFVALIVTDNEGDTVFHSGKMDENYQLTQEDVPFEAHHDMINNEGQVQLYEMVMGDVNGDLTTVLLYADHQLKDNRLPPIGFTDQHNNYDTVAIVGAAVGDVDFNKMNGSQGSGSDIVHYNIPTYGQTGPLSITVSVYYQTVSSRWLEETFSHTSTEIDRFKAYYQQADLAPTLVASETIQSMSIGMAEKGDVSGVIIFPNPCADALKIRYRMPDAGCQMINLFSITGKKIRELMNEVKMPGTYEMEVDVSDLQEGIYIVMIQTGSDIMSRKLVVVR